LFASVDTTTSYRYRIEGREGPALAERRSDDPEFASRLRIEERELEAGRLN